MEINILKFIQSFSSDFLDAFFRIVTELGGEYIFVAAVITLYWCYDKRFAFKFLFVYLIGIGINTGLKDLIARPRPFDFSSEINNLEPSNIGASMPSGHAFGFSLISTQAYNEYSIKSKNNTNLKHYKPYVKWGMVILIFLLCLSRMYLGQHYLSDVIVGTALGIGFSYLADFIFKFMGKNEEIYGLIVAFVVLITCKRGLNSLLVPYSTYSTFFMLAALIISAMVGYFLEKKFVKYEPRTNIKKQLFKIAFGIFSTGVLLLVLNLTLKPILILVFVKYFILGLWVFFGVMYMFKVLTKLFDKKTKFNSNSVKCTEKIGERIGKKLQKGSVVLLLGDLGAGKTAFTKGIAKGLEVKETVVSPTFTIMNEYLSGKMPLYHFDMYRIGSADEIQETGLTEYLNSGNGICVLEWPQNIAPILPKKVITIEILKTKNINRRIIKIEGVL